jgi:hypothetical protein
MKIATQRIREIIHEELSDWKGPPAGPGYDRTGKRSLRWSGTKEKWPSSAAVKRVFQDVVRATEKRLSRDARMRAMQWIDGNWEKMPNHATAKEAITQWLEDQG